MGTLSTHVLDTSSGLPAAGMAYRLERVAPGPRIELQRGTTNADGRSDGPLLAGAQLQIGTFELHFEVAAYFRARGMVLPDPPFLDVVSVRFGIADEQAQIHVPLLVSPWSYSTYRGS